MTSELNHRHVLRVVIELITPFLVGSGREGDIADAVFVSDANGLPAIPGSSLAGVLRSAFRGSGGSEEAEKRIFGYQEGDEGAGSRLLVSWACIHDSKDEPVEGIVSSERMRDDVLVKAMSPAIRDHVRINHKGASDAEGRGKFDEQAVCAGHRFTFELEMVGDGGEQARKDWEDLIAVLKDPSLRLGGKTRRGFGAFKIVKLMGRVFDLRQDFDEYVKHPVSLVEPTLALERVDVSTEENSGPVFFKLNLKPRGYWMFGGGHDLLESSGEADMAPVRDSRVVWKNDRGFVENDLIIIPATGIKGALSHRVAFHYNALTGVFADKNEVGDKASMRAFFAKHTGEGNEAVRALFGCIKGNEKDEQGDTQGQRGCLLIDDKYLERDLVDRLVHHVGIDRFTGGARDRVLFTEKPLWSGRSISLTIRFVGDTSEMEDNIKKAFSMALNDLVSGRLQVGAGSGRGEGYLEGEIEWPEETDWPRA